MVVSMLRGGWLLLLSPRLRGWLAVCVALVVQWMPVLQTVVQVALVTRDTDHFLLLAASLRTLICEDLVTMKTRICEDLATMQTQPQYWTSTLLAEGNGD